MCNTSEACCFSMLVLFQVSVRVFGAYEEWLNMEMKNWINCVRHE